MDFGIWKEKGKERGNRGTPGDRKDDGSGRGEGIIIFIIINNK